MPERVPAARGRWPLLGHVPQLRRGPLGFMQSLRARGDFVRVDIGLRPVYVVNSPELIRQVLIGDRHRYEKGLLFDKTRPLLGNGLVVSGGEFHRRQRRLIQPAFRPERLERYAVSMGELVRERAASWRPGNVVSLDREFHDLTMTVVDRTLFSSSIGASEAATVHRCLPIVERGFVRRALSPLPLLERLPIPANRRFEAARLELRAVVENVIRRRRETGDGVDHGDLLQTLIRSHDERGGMSDTQLRDELITLMLAGTDTTALSLTWLFWSSGDTPRSSVGCRRSWTSRSTARHSTGGRSVGCHTSAASLARRCDCTAPSGSSCGAPISPSNSAACAYQPAPSSSSAPPRFTEMRGCSLSRSSSTPIAGGPTVRLGGREGRSCPSAAVIGSASATPTR